MTMTTTRVIPTEVMEYLALHHVITVSTPSFTGMPHADTVVYVNDETRLYFYVNEGSTLARNIHDSKYVSFTIDDYLPDWRKLRELQGVGRGYVAEPNEVAAVARLVSAKFGPTFSAPGRLHGLAPIEMHFVDYDQTVVRRGNRMFQFDDGTSPGGAPVAAELDRLVFEAGQVVFRPGDRDVEFYVVLEGTVEVRAEGFGADQTVVRVGPGQMFGDSAALHGQRGALTAHAVDRVSLLRVERDVVRSLAMNPEP